jgi:hypothetical protein
MASLPTIAATLNDHIFYRSAVDIRLFLDEKFNGLVTPAPRGSMSVSTQLAMC